MVTFLSDRLNLASEFLLNVVGRVVRVAPGMINLFIFPKETVDQGPSRAAAKTFLQINQLLVLLAFHHHQAIIRIGSWTQTRG